MQVKISSIFENTIGNVLSSILLLVLLPAATAVQSSSSETESEIKWYATPTFVASVLIGIFLVILFQFCRLLYKENEKLKDKSSKLETALVAIHYKTEVIGKISSVRNHALFLKQFEHVEYFKLPGESEDDLWARLPQGGLYYEHLLEEYQEVRKWCEKTYKDKSGKEIDAMLKRFYPPEFYDQSTL